MSWFVVSIAKDREEEARHILFLTLEDDWSFLSCLSFSPHQVEELIKGYEVVIEGLRLELGGDTSTASTATSRKHALINRVLVVVLPFIVKLSVLYNEIVLFLLNILAILFICQVTFSTFLAYLRDFLVWDEGDCAEFVSGDHLGRIGRIILDDGSTKDYLTAVVLICSQVQEALPDADDLL